VPHRRPRKKGSFGSHLDELVELFPPHDAQDPRPSERSAELQEKIDIHARLFERAWAMDDR
jgi:hypothetical protein